MIGHIDRNPALRVGRYLVGFPTTSLPLASAMTAGDARVGADALSTSRAYVLVLAALRIPHAFGPPRGLRQSLGNPPPTAVCIVTVGGSVLVHAP